MGDMRKVLVALLLLIVLGAAAGALCIFKGKQLSTFVDRHGITEEKSEQIKFARYEGNGSGGILHVNESSLSLNDAVAPLRPPSVGSTKDGKLGVAAEGKVFPLGRLPQEIDNMDEALAAAPEPGDDARIILGHSRLSWPTPFNINFMTGHSPSWKRHSYQRLTWTKPNGHKLEMLWRYEQNFDQANGWTSATMTREGETGLVKIEIKP
jgi:hypothetical protein